MGGKRKSGFTPAELAAAEWSKKRKEDEKKHEKLVMKNLIGDEPKKHKKKKNKKKKKRKRRRSSSSPSPLSSEEGNIGKEEGELVESEVESDDIPSDPDCIDVRFQILINFS